jgi:dipeptidyl aminopeptidase/acylaminoacyl peptidase
MKNLFRLMLLVLLFPFSMNVAKSQQKIMQNDAYGIWKKIDQQRIANNGEWVAYSVVPNTEGDSRLHLWNAKTQQNQVFERATEFAFSADNQFLVFRIKPALDSLKAKRRKKVKEDDLPKDTLGILNLQTNELRRVASVKNYQLPQKWAGYIAYQLEPAAKKKEEVKKDSTQKEPPVEKKTKAENKENGSKLIVENLLSQQRDTFLYVTDYGAAKKGKKFIIASSGIDSARVANVEIFNGEEDVKGSRRKIIVAKKGKYKQLALDEKGEQAAFIADLDTSTARVRPFQLMAWQNKMDSAKVVASSKNNFDSLQNMNISENYRPTFSEDGLRLFFGIAAQPILNDTMLLPEEIVNVEVWHYQEPILHTQQKVLLEQEKKRSYDVCLKTADILGGGLPRINLIASPDLMNIQYQKNANIALAYTDKPYRLAATWEGIALRDVYLIDLNTSKKTLIQKALRGQTTLSPSAKYAIWYDENLKNWYSFDVTTQKTRQLTDNNSTKFYDEENDVPDAPNPYGIAFFSAADKSVVLYDKYDLWRIDLQKETKPTRLTRGRERENVHRYLSLDNEERFVEDDQKLLLSVVNQTTKAESYAELDWKSGAVKTVLPMANVALSRPIKAKNATALMFSKQNFQTFPDILWTQNTDFDRTPLVSNVNPQQSEYGWGTIELVTWTDANGSTLTGMLVKPANFDSTKTYPMIVNFYERSSDQLNNYRTIEAGRSQINYSFYANRGYLIFNPDIPYREGYPGESCLSAVVSGVTMLINKGFVDKTRIGVQGHSWGGYQSAYLITKTNIFKCAESGAPVVNMISAYNGIRWESGLLRQFQYEHQQSRIGGDLWRFPLRYIENSPIFSLDKVQTPVLILHNDKDGAVPWYQGIEFFGSLRRMNKPAWLLNYNDEPHWPVKLQNRLDFQQRMQQFFDFYLKDAPMPKWMERGVPEIEKGILQGLENR